MGSLVRRLLQLAVLAWFIGLVAALIGAARAKRDAPPPPDPAADEVDLRAILGPLDFSSTASRFRGGSLICWFGGGMLDLRGATPDPAGARLQLRAIYGGAQVVVPQSWEVELRVVGLMGGAGDSRPQQFRPADAPRLTIEGVAIVGGVGVTAEPPREMPGASPA